MRKFRQKNSNDFLLGSEAAKILYHEFASKMPIVDYHCHIDAAEIYSDKRFSNLAEVWLGGDHYKWRLMRACGIGEEYITGKASDWEKFSAFAEILPNAVANPAYHWAHMELQRFFDCDKPLCLETAREIWELTSNMLAEDYSLSARGIMKRMNVELIVTTDDPADTLEWHIKLANDAGFSTKVLPCFRPDAAFNIENRGFAEYIAKLGKPAGHNIDSYNTLKEVLLERIGHFADNGCKAADHGCWNLIYAPTSDNEIAEIFAKGMHGEPLTALDASKYRYALLKFCAVEYARLGWVMELHLGVLRDVNTAMQTIGPNTGFDCIGTRIDIKELSRILDELNKSNILPKTLIFPIDPNDNAAVNTLAGCFTETGVKGKIQQGSAWWFNDSYYGIRAQLISFSENGVLGNIVGMLTDSRSFMSYPRHEYFRRILCELLGNFVETGFYPDNMEYLGKLVQDICYYNTKQFFGF